MSDDTIQLLDNMDIEGEDADSGSLQIDPNNTNLVWREWTPSIRELKSLRESGDLVLQPKWQRKFVWDIKKSSKLIESILINVPLPSIYLDKDEKGLLTAIDGQQRLTALTSFLEGQIIDPKSSELKTFKLTSLDVKPELNGKTFAELDKVDQRTILNYPVNCIVIEAKSNPDIKFEIFERLNTGSVKLNDDELRNSIYRGPFIDLLEELTEDKNFVSIINRKLFHNRMVDRGMILRFLTFYERTYLKYKPPVKQFLNNLIQEYRELSPAKSEEFRSVFKISVELSKTVFGDKAFRRFVPATNDTQEGKWNTTRINMALFDIIMWGFTRYDKATIISHADSIREELINLMSNDQEFINSIMFETSGTEMVNTRFDIWSKKLNEILGYPGNSEPRIFSFALKRNLFESNPTCAICNQQLLNIDDCEVDHIEQYWKGGKTIPENARLTHRFCNRKRGKGL